MKKYFDHFGIMLECSRNAVPNIEFLKEYVEDIGKMGYNFLQLYTEETYEIDGEPYFGYLRGRFTKEELKEINAFGKEHGVEIVPCIQTLAHLNCALRWFAYDKIHDCRDIMLAGEEDTYVLIEKMFKTMRECFDTKYINIGMDEAHFIGLGKYLDKHGFENRFDIITTHLKRVIDICNKYDFKPIMWSDMFFRLANNGVYRKNDPFDFPDTLFEKVPNEVALCYWDYYNDEPEQINNMLSEHKRFNNEIWFGGGCWSWEGFTPSNYVSFKRNDVAIKCCIENGVRNFIMTIWGDDGHETSKLGNYPSLYYSACLAKGITDKDKIANGFEKLFGISIYDCLKLDYPNEIQEHNTFTSYEDSKADNPSKYMFYNDLLMGIFDYTVNDTAEDDYKRYAKELLPLCNNEKFGYAFKQAQALCDVLSIKYALGVKLRKAYKADDKKALKTLYKEILKLPKKIEIFYDAFRNQWYKENKPFGFEIQDARIGGLILRVKNCAKTVKDYIDGKISNITELDQEILKPIWYAQPGRTVSFNRYGDNISAGVLTHNPL
ncbi:MAG: beta-N-acetylhexosaminidase [Clostridia bacterium]|nr:beta-N-acetylhexosaminidase [Clostridia bacterium]